MVRVFQQNAVSRAAMQDWIAAKQQAENQRRQQQFNNLLPDAAIDFISGFHQISTGLKGGMGEAAVFLRALLSLPDSWIIFNDVFLQPAPNQFAQIDHVLIGPPGIFIVETKAWKGAFLGNRDQWQRKDAAGQWVKCSSPTMQNLRHAKLFRQWISPVLPFPQPTNIELWVVPVVVMTRTQWLRTHECSMSVCWGMSQLMEYLAARPKRFLTSEQVDQLAQLIANPPQPSPTQSSPARRPKPVQAPVRTKPTAPEPIAALACRQCRSSDLSIQYGYSYYFKCCACGGNTAIRPPDCPLCKAPQRLRKDRQQFFLECSSCQSSHLFFTNPS